MKTPAEALEEISRALFIPDVVYVPGPDYQLVPLRRSEHPERWRRLVGSEDEAVITKVGPDPLIGKGVVATSSSSSPEIMTAMIDALDLRAGMRVLEIGTGTGYNAAVLAYILGAENVTSIEIDPEVAAQARSALDRAGYPLHVVTGDGANGYAPAAPYDRVVVTASVHTVPHAWIEQTRPGGILLIPWAPTVHPDWPLARLTVTGQGAAEGRFIGQAGFMPLRAQHLLPRVSHETEERWVAAGKPDLTRFGVTVTAEGQTVWLDSPDNPIASEGGRAQQTRSRMSGLRSGVPFSTISMAPSRACRARGKRETSSAYRESSGAPLVTVSPGLA
jgi:protein-L-isoaspartate(D-aspartate) O-methyltransferase